MATSFSSSAYAGTSYSGADMLATITIKNTDQYKNATCVLGELQTLSYSTHMERSGVRKLGNVNVADYTNGPRTIAGSLVFAVFNRHVIRPILDQMGVTDEILSDEMPPFDLTITYANEYGHDSVMRIYGIRLVNEGQVCSINDVYIENTYQYVATNLELMEKTELQLASADQSAQTEESEETAPPAVEDLIDLDASNVPIIDTNPNAPQLRVKTEQQKVYFDVSNKPNQSKIILNGTTGEAQRYNLFESDWPFVIALTPDDYVAQLYSAKEDIVYNSVQFQVEAPKAKAPCTTQVTATNISGTLTDATVKAVKAVDSLGQEYTAAIHQNKFSFSQLSPNLTYRIYTYADEAGLEKLNLEEIVIQTPPKDSSIFDAFHYFIEVNGLDNEAFNRYFVQSKKYYAEHKTTTFLEACYYTYQNALNDPSAESFPENFLHWVSYFDLSCKQKSLHFDFANKWLTQLKNHALATSYRLYDNNGIVANQTTPSEGLIKYQQLYGSTLEKLMTYQPTIRFYQDLQKGYISQADFQTQLKDNFNRRYNTLPIHLDFGYYDQSFVTYGAYLTIQEDNTLNACLELSGYAPESVYYVFKDDLNTTVSFKAPVTAQALAYQTLPFYCEAMRYVVYLEADGKPISHCLFIENDIPTYSYDTLLALSVKKKMTALAQELCLEGGNLFESFCFGFYLLVNRKMLTNDYITLMDEWFYTQAAAKADYVHYYIQNSCLYFERPVCLIHFDKQGNFIDLSYSDVFESYATGYLVWVTPEHKMHAINLENI